MNLEENYEVFEFYKLLVGSIQKIVFWDWFVCFFPFRVNKIANLIAIKWLKKDLRVILDIFPKDQIISRFSEFDLDQDQDHQI